MKFFIIGFIITVLNTIWPVGVMGVCQTIPGPQHGRIVGNPVYVVNTTLQFDCLEGYIIVGNSSMLCRADGNWIPKVPPTCHPVKCEAFGKIPNGTVLPINSDVALNNFGSKIRIKCNDGYNLIGSPIMTCKSKGTWGRKPWCKKFICGTHPGTKSTCIYDSSADHGTFLSLQCRDNSANVSVTVAGTRTESIPNSNSSVVLARCYNNQWDNLDMGCFCDCLVDMDSKGLTYYKLFKNKFVKHGDNLNWECDEGYKKQGLTNISCSDGQMERPHCIRVETRREMPGWVYVIIIVCIVLIVIVVCCVGTNQKHNNTKKDQSKEYQPVDKGDESCDKENEEDEPSCNESFPLTIPPMPDGGKPIHPQPDLPGILPRPGWHFINNRS